MAANGNGNGNRNGNGHRPGRNAPDALYEVYGNVAAMLCTSCGAPYVVSAYADRQYSDHWQGWRVCPHCMGTESTIYWAGYDDDDRPIYKAAQRLLSADERKQVAASEPTKLAGNRRLIREKREIDGLPHFWR